MAKTRIYEFDGKSLTLAQWAELYNIPHKVLNQRVNKHKWDFVDALQIPVGRSRPKWKKEKSKRKIENDRKNDKQE